MEWVERDGLRWLEADLGDARAAFTTRLGGASEGAYASLNLGLLTDDDPAAVNENRRRLCGALGIEADRIAFGRQVHGTRLAAPRSPRCAFFGPPGGQDPRSAPEEADGQVVAEGGVAGLVFVADCLPVALRGPGGVAMLHCGWRGLAAGIVAKGVEAVGATDAAIGPGIGPCCFEVGDEVLDVFAGLGEGVAAGRMLDLSEVARRQLAAAGVERIESADLCTSCNPALFFSHRRDDGVSGRQAGLVWMAAA